MSGVPSSKHCALLLVASSLALALACGGGAAGPSAKSADGADSTGEAPGPRQKPPASTGVESLAALREKLKSPPGKELDLAGKGFGAELGTVLGGAATLEGVEKLDASDNDLGADGARGLLASPHLGSLSALDLGGNEIGDAGAGALGESQLPHLLTLNLSGNGIGTDGAKALAKGKGYPALSSLDLSMNPIGADGVKALSALGKLSALFLLGSEIGADGARALSKGSFKLKVLALSGNSIGDDGAKALAASPKLSGLATLDLSANGIGDAGAKALAASPHLKGLTKLEMFANDLSATGKGALAKRFGDAVKL